MTLLRPRVGDWSQSQSKELLAAARCVRTRGFESPWLLELRGHRVLVYERLAVRRRDPVGRDRLRCCGAVVANLHATIRALGWEPELVLERTREPDLLAVLRAGRRREPTGIALARHDAITRIAAAAEIVPLLSPVDSQTGAWLAGADWCPHTDARLLAGPKTAAILGELVLHAARCRDGDRRVAGELAAWLGGAAMRPARFAPYRQVTSAIAARIAAERVLLVLTPDDGRIDQVMAGAAMQAIRLAACTSGLATAPVTALLDIPEARSGLIDAAKLPGFPQALIRVGRVPVPAKPARRYTHRPIRPLPVDWW